MQRAAVGQPAGSQTSGAPIQIPADATVQSLFSDFVHYARLGRFNVADAYAKALLAHPELDPVVLLEIANKDRKSIDTLLVIVQFSTIGDSARKVLELIDQGEHIKRQDLERIEKNIELLGGDPQQEFMAVLRLADAGEYAVPAILRALLDPQRSALWPRISAALPKIGKPAVNPLVIALNVTDENARLHVVRALGEIGYAQAIPYLLKLSLDLKVQGETRDAATRAIRRIEEIAGRAFPGSADEHFYALAERYFEEDEAVRADPRLPEANLWYWDAPTQTLNRVPVAERLFGPIMAMRCVEEALNLRHDFPDALALWLASNIRRESRLGLNVESGDPSEKGEADPTRPEAFPRALYFTQAAGPRYAHAVLQRAIDNRDSAVALGAIEALRTTAGESSLIGSEEFKQPLVQALQFPDQMVRLRAALALGAALPKSPFTDSDWVIPVLASGLRQTGKERMLVVDPDEANRNRLVGLLRSRGRETIAERNFFRGLDRVRSEFQVITAALIASDVNDPILPEAVGAFRSEFPFSQTPVVVLAKPKQRGAAEQVHRTFPFVGTVDAAVEEAGIEDAISRLRDEAGQSLLDANLALSLALESAVTLRKIAEDGRTVFNVEAAEAALIAALSSPEEQLRTACASVLALFRTPTAQRALAHLALDAGQSESLRLAVFDSLAESARGFGNMLEESQVAELVRMARVESNLVLRTAAGKALGALNLPANQAGEIVRSFYGG
jgi:HEAT repeat protein